MIIKSLKIQNLQLIKSAQVDFEKIMGEVLDLFENKNIGDLARKRIYSCPRQTW